MALFVTMTNSDKESAMKTRNLLLACCLVGGITGCANMSSGEQRTLSGAGIGAAAGALVGELAALGPLPDLGNHLLRRNDFTFLQTPETFYDNGHGDY